MNRLKATPLIFFCAAFIATVQETALGATSEVFAGSESKDDGTQYTNLIERVDSLLLHSEYSAWQRERIELQSEWDDSHSPDTQSSILSFLFEPHSLAIPFMDGLSTEEQNKANWALIRYARMEQLHQQQKRAETPFVDIEPERPVSFWWVLPSILLTMSFLLWAWLQRKSAGAADSESYHNTHIARLVNYVNRKDLQCDPALELALFEFNSGWSPIQGLMEKHSKGTALSPNQKLILHLIWRNIQNTSITSHLGITNGHFYNERSAIRKHLKFKPTEDIRSEIDRMLH